MANHVSHAALPYPIKNARFTLFVPYLDADGDPTDPTTPDTEVSGDAGAFADCAEEVTTITGSNGTGYITLTGAETNYSMVALAAKVASGPKATLATLYPRVLATLESGTAQAGAAGTITLAAGAPAYDITGCFVRTTGGTGGGGVGGANNQARIITAYNTSTKVATVAPNWETTPDATTTYDVLLPAGVPSATFKALQPTVLGRTLDVSAGGEAGVDWANVGTPGSTVALSATTVGTATNVGTVTGNVNGSVGSVTGAVGSVTGNVGGNVAGSVASVTAAVTVGTNNDKTGYALSAAGVQAIWDALTAALTTANSIGKRLADNIDAAISTRSTLSAADVWASGTRTLTSFGTLVADIWANGTRTLTGFSTALAVSVWDVLESSIATASSIGVKLKTNLDAAISSRSSHSAADTWAVATRTLTAGTNIVLAKGTGVTGFNDIAAADVWSVGTRTLSGNQGIKKNTALANFAFRMTDSTNHVPTAGLTVTAQRSLDGAAFAACTNAVTEIGSGWYKITFAAGDLNGDTVALKFTATGADQLDISLVTAP